MNRLAPRRSPAALLFGSPVALLGVCALLCGLAAAVLGLSTEAHAASARIGTFTLEPAAGSIKDAQLATSATTDAACPAPADPQAPYVRAGLRLPKPAAATGGLASYALTTSAAGAPLDSGPFTAALPAGASLESVLRKYVKTGPLDGTYEIRLHCDTATSVGAFDHFSASVRVTGENWALVRAQATTMELTGPATAAGAPLKLTAALTPAAAAGRVSFGAGTSAAGPFTEAGAAELTGGKAELTVTAPAKPGLAYYSATFTPTDPEAFSGTSDLLAVTVTDAAPSPDPSATDPTGKPTDGPTEPADLDVTDADGKPLDANPALEAGQKVLVTARGYTKGATVKVALADSGATLADATADAEGTVDAYAFTVPAGIEDGDHTLTLAEDKADGHSVVFAFVTGEQPSPTPDPSDTAGTDDGGTTSGGMGGDAGDAAGAAGGGSGGSGGQSAGPLASTGGEAGAIGLAAAALISLGAAIVIHVRRRGLLTFGRPAH
ncbi:hypothetical protein AB0L80_16115 [Streptomyces sp. NPDC052069]|uniref:hypothetical protein n=1 Tax=Streptomyces sp. NPDC052069 TaxID=3154650 RepID=UPI00343A98F1